MFYNECYLRSNEYFCVVPYKSIHSTTFIKNHTMQQTKQALYEICKKNIEQRIASIEQRLAAIKESRNNETKSSAGDKYETGRAMMQIEEQNSKVQLAEAYEVKKKLSSIDVEKGTAEIGQGSLVTTNRGNYFIAIGIGKVKLGNDLYFCISVQSPIGQQMRGKKIGDEIVFNNNKIRIKELG